MEKGAEERYPPVEQMTDAQRIRAVKEIFSTVTGRYDFLNHLLSLRRDIAWRRYAVRKMRFFRTYRLLDVATGTADLAIEAARCHPSIQVTGLDFVKVMMDRGAIKIAEKGFGNRIRLLQGDALDLPFPDHSFDSVAIAFGIRNIPDRERALREMKRVTAPGGQVMVLEMTFPKEGFLKGFYRLYLHQILPRLGRILSKNPAAYQYLTDSIVNFPTPPAFARMMEEAGLARVENYSLDFGMTYLHTGINPGMDQALG